MKPNYVLVIAIGIALIFDILTGFFAITLPPVINHQSLGTWNNFPSATQGCDSTQPAPTGFTNCEFMGNESYRPPFTVNDVGLQTLAGYRVLLTVGCLRPSNNIGAKLQLQYANYSFLSALNTSNWANISGATFIDNDQGGSGNCPGSPSSQVAGQLPSINANQPIGFIFRVLGFDGGGAGDNPQFSFVHVDVYSVVARTITTVITSTLTGSFRFILYSTFAAVSAISISIRYIATNQTSTACAASDDCIQSGTSSCTFNAGANLCPSSGSTQQNFPHAFTGTVQVTANVLTGLGVQQIFNGFLTVFQTEVITT